MSALSLADDAPRLEKLAYAPGAEALRARGWQKLSEVVRKHSRFSHADWAMDTEVVRALAALEERLAPADPVSRSQWLFDDHLPDLPDEEDDFQASR